MEPTPGLAQSTIKNSVWNLAAFVWPIFFAIFVTPIIVHRLNVASYGILVLVNTVLSILALLELGLGAALLKSIAEEAVSKDYNLLRARIGIVLSLNLAVGLVGFLIMGGIGAIGLAWFKIPLVQQPEARIVFLIGAFVFLGSSLLNTLTVVPQAMQRYDLTAKVSLVFTALTNLATLIAVLLGYKLVMVLFLQLVFVLLTLGVYYLIAKKLLPQVPIGFAFRIDEIKASAHFGGFVFIKNIATQALAHFDKVIVSSFLGPTAVSFYSLPGNVAVKSVGVVSSLTEIFFPLTSQMSASGQFDKIAEIYRRVFRNIMLLAAAAASALVFFSYKILFFWLGKEFADTSFQVLQILALTYFLLSLYIPLTNFLLGLGAVRLIAGASVFMLALNMVFLVILLPRFGIIGAAWAYLLAVVPAPAFLIFAERRYLHIKGQMRFYWHMLLKLVVVTAVSYLAARFVFLPITKNVYSLIIAGPACVVFYLVAFKLFGFMPEEDWQTVKSYLISLKQKLFFYGKPE